MGRTAIWVFFLSMVLLLRCSVSVVEEDRRALLDFFDQLSGGFRPKDDFIGWNLSSDPCAARWTGVDCKGGTDVRRLALEGLGLAGTLNMKKICSVQSIAALSIQNNSVKGQIPDDFSSCRQQLTHLYLSGNKLSGSLPESISNLNNLKKLVISSNNLSGELPDLTKISGMALFLAENNNLSGQIPQLDFANLQLFNVSFNNFSGPVPNLGRFNISSVMGNPLLCGKPFKNTCPPAPTPTSSGNSKSKSKFGEKILMFSGYILVGAVFVLFILFKLVNRKKAHKAPTLDKPPMIKDGNTKSSHISSVGHRTNPSKSDHSTQSGDSTSMLSSSLVVLTRSPVKGLRFEDLLKAPAELLGRGRYGSLYKVMFGDGSTLAVKRIKDWSISKDEFQSRMEKIDQTKHPHVLSPVAYYCSQQEKLVVYEYQQNGSLFKLLHGGENARMFDWGSRLNVAFTMAEALAFMHKELKEDGIGHGNLKSSNIMLNNSMEACISEYGLMVIDDQSSSGIKPIDQSKIQPDDTFKSDVYKLGVILLELLTGKLVQTNGFDLARWVHSVVREEWTVEVFDRALIVEGASEERMVNLLQLALKCINPSPAARPEMNQVANLINTIKEEEERSVVSET